VSDEVASLSYSFDGGEVVFEYTYVPTSFRGKGVAAALVRRL
jgi:predicted GNAT family acetyltransferase